MLKYIIPFDEKLFVEQTILTLPYLYPDEVKKIKHSKFFTLLMFGIGGVILMTGSELSTLFFAIGIFGIFDLYWRQERYRNLKDDHIRVIRSFAQSENGITNGIFEFNDICVRFSNDFLCTWINWDDFENYRIKKSNLILIPIESKKDIMVLGESEISIVEFERVVDFVKSKLD